jgi:hypothetical protein
MLAIVGAKLEKSWTVGSWQLAVGRKNVSGQQSAVSGRLKLKLLCILLVLAVFSLYIWKAIAVMLLY